MKALQQGDADGLCGIYALLNFLQTTSWREEDAQKGLWLLLRSVERLGLLTPQDLIDGYTDFELKAILEDQLASYRLEYRVHYLRDTCEDMEISSFPVLVDRVAARKGSIIASQSGSDHWFLVHGGRGKARVFDSAGGHKAKDFHPSQRASIDEGGLIILPVDRPKVVIDI